MSIIKEFIKQYNKEFDFYQKLAQIVSSRVEDQLIKQGIKAIVTNRAKRPDRLEEKLTKRYEEKKYKSTDEIFADIVDLAGVRVSLYFPSDREVVDELITELFDIDKKKIFPAEAHIPKHNKRFSGYWATHYRIRLRLDTLTERYKDTVVEIQVASVLMHGWSEVEHDLVYKPFSGELSREELAILDEINGLVLSGEIALERLQSAIARRTSRKTDITDKYELTNFLLNTFENTENGNIKIGDTFLLNNLLRTTQKLNTNELIRLIENIDRHADESVTEQLINVLLFDNYRFDKSIYKNYFKNLHITENKASHFESFVKCWIILETGVRELYNEDNVQPKKSLVPDFTILMNKEILTTEELKQLTHLKRLRNNLLHGIDAPSSDSLEINYSILKQLTAKVVNKIADNEVKSRLINELSQLG